MKKLYLMIVLILSFFKTEAQSNHDLDPAASEILSRINSIENQFENYKNGNYERFYYVHGISLLSGINAKIFGLDYSGLHFTPDENEINLWKKWFDDNKNNFSFVENSDSEMSYELFNHKIIQIEYENGKYRYDVSEVELEYYREIFPELVKLKSQKLKTDNLQPTTKQNKIK